MRRPHLRTAFWAFARAKAAAPFAFFPKLVRLDTRLARKTRFATATCLSTLCFCAVGMSSTESAVANGDTRTIRLHHAHTGEDIEATYRVNGRYDPAVLEKLNWFLRDWRRNEATKMDPRLFDAVWEAYRGAGATEPVVVVCGYRSPETNAMLRSRSRAVAEHSQHMLGKAMDTTMPGMSMERVREVAMRLQMGGVGYYGSSNFVHIDVGGVRSWPRMNYDQLVRLFPDGKTVHIASNGQTLARYEEARAELAARGSVDLPPSSQGVNFFAWLFGSHGEDEREETAAASVPQPASVRVASRSRPAETPVQADDTSRTARASDRAATDRPMVASLTGLRGFRRGEVDSSTDADAAVPLPPARPAALVALLDKPQTPTRPDRVAVASVSPATPVSPAGDTVAAGPKKDAIGSLIASASVPSPTHTASLPSLITQGASTTQKSSTTQAANAPAAVLAYAASAQIEGLRTAARSRNAKLPVQVAAMQPPPPLLPARLDHSNFLVMTGSVETARMRSQTVLGPTVAGLRQVAHNQSRLQVGALTNVAMVSAPSRFAVASNDLPIDHFVMPSGTAYAVNSDRDHPLVGALALKSSE